MEQAIGQISTLATGHGLLDNLGVTPAARPHEGIRPELVVLVVHSRPGL